MSVSLSTEPSDQTVAKVIGLLDAEYARAAAQRAASATDPSGREELSPPVPDLDDIHRRLAVLVEMDAPLYLETGPLLKRMLSRLVNIPLRLIHAKQRIYDREMLALISEVLIINEHLLIYINSIKSSDAQRQRDR